MFNSVIDGVDPKSPTKSAAWYSVKSVGSPKLSQANSNTLTHNGLPPCPGSAQRDNNDDEDEEDMEEEEDGSGEPGKKPSRRAVVKGPWTAPEDERLVELVREFGPKKWKGASVACARVFQP